MISLELLSEANSLDVYSFEKENREYFERSLPPRPAAYFDSEGFKEITRELLTEQENHDAYMHIIRLAIKFKMNPLILQIRQFRIFD